MEVLFGLILLAVVAALVTVPLRRERGAGLGDPLRAELADLEERKQVRYREIRDLAVDRAAGKIAGEDFERLDRELRADAIAILKRIDQVEAERSRAPSNL